MSANCVISSSTPVNKAKKFAVPVAKLYVSAVTLLTDDHAKLLNQLKSGFKRTINWNQYQSKVSIQEQKPYLVSLFDPNFHGTNRYFVLSFDNKAVGTRYFLPRV